MDGATLSSGGSGITISGIPMSVGAGGFVIGSDTISLPTANASASGPIVPFKGAAPKAHGLSKLLLLSCGLATLMVLWNGVTLFLVALNHSTGR